MLHGILITQLQALGYFDGLPGICLGFTIRWLEAALTGEEGKWFSRLKLLEEMGESLPSALSKVKNKVQKDITPSDEEIKLFDALAFLESVSLYNAPGHFDISRNSI